MTEESPRTQALAQGQGVEAGRSLADALMAGRMTSREAVDTCFARIADLDEELQAFVAQDQAGARRCADRCDADATADKATRPLAGLPFAAKDIFATTTMPTAFGSPLYEGHQASSDASAVALLQAAGGVLIGKTATVEFASVGAIPPTRNPWNLEHSPGGSSAGSGAAVGAGLVPLALASQTGGSTIRPAAYCGAVGYKPTWGRISTEGMKPFAPSLDTVGLIASHADVLGRAAQAFGMGPPRVSDRPLKIGWFKTPYFDEADAPTRAMLASIRSRLASAGHQIEEIAVPDGSDCLNAWQDIVMHGEGGISFRSERARFGDRLHPRIIECADNRKGITPGQISESLDALGRWRTHFDALMNEFDAWVTPAVPGEAPAWSPDDSGSAVFNRLFTALHAPCVSLPAGFGPRGLPLSIQLVAARNRDQELIAAASVVEALLRADRSR